MDRKKLVNQSIEYIMQHLNEDLTLDLVITASAQCIYDIKSGQGGFLSMLKKYLKTLH